MPRRAPTACREHRCPNLVDAKVGYCKDHIRAHEAAMAKRSKVRHRKYNKQRDSSPEEVELQRFYRTGAWRRVRNDYLARSPLCEHCAMRSRVTVGSIVDHIAERRDGGDSFDQDNMQTLCASCHQHKTNDERGKR